MTDESDRRASLFARLRVEYDEAVAAADRAAEPAAINLLSVEEPPEADEAEESSAVPLPQPDTPGPNPLFAVPLPRVLAIAKDHVQKS